jgi:hypothetical protein
MCSVVMRRNNDVSGMRASLDPSWQVAHRSA